MTKITKEIAVVVKKQKRIYTPFELQEFDIYLQANKNRTYTLANGEVLTRYDWDKIYKENKVITDKGVIIRDFDGANFIPLLDFEEKIEQWKWWKSGKQFGEEKKL